MSDVIRLHQTLNRHGKEGSKEGREEGYQESRSEEGREEGHEEGREEEVRSPAPYARRARSPGPSPFQARRKAARLFIVSP